jgi:hypothetical protein
MKTNFSFEVQYPAQPDGSQAATQDDAMKSLGTHLQSVFAKEDAAAKVVTSDSHKGSGHQLVELTTTLNDEQIGKLLQAFSTEHGVSITALE